jgi:hypothetical protein
MTFDLILRILATMSTLIIGVAASILAFQQFRISKAKLKFDLYDKRLAPFRRVREYVDEIAVTTDSEPAFRMNNLASFRRDTLECRFLFDAKVVADVDEINKKVRDLDRIEKILRAHDVTGNNHELNLELNDLKVWFAKQNEEIFQIFKEDLSIKTLR